MPDYVPMHHEMVLWSGVAEIVGGIAVFRPGDARFARWWLLGVLAAVFPANVHMALHPERYKQIPPVALWARLPLQFAAPGGSGGDREFRAYKPSSSAYFSRYATRFSRISST